MYKYKENDTEAHDYQTTETKDKEKSSYVKHRDGIETILLVWSRAKAAHSGVSAIGSNFLIVPEAV